MGVLHALARATGAAVIGLDHFGKDGTRGTRGSSAKEGSADFVLALLGERDEDGAVSDLRMALRKVRGGATGRPTPFSLKVVSMGIDEDNDPVTSCVIEWGEAGGYVRPEKAKRELPSTRLLLGCDRLSGRPTQTRDEVRDAFWKVFPRDKSDEARRGAFFRGIEALELVEDAGGMLDWPKSGV